MTVPADALAPTGARPPAGSVMTVTFDMFSVKFLWISTFSYAILTDDTKNGRRGLTKYRGT